MAHERFRLHSDFRLIDLPQPGENTLLLRQMTRLVGAGQSFAISTAPALRIDALPAPADGMPQLSCQTSGSSGRPKRILRSQTSWIASFEVNRQAFALTGADRHAILGSLASSLASYAAVEAMHLGTGLIDLCGASPAQQLRQLGDAGASLLYCSPAQLRLLIAAARATGAPPLPAPCMPELRLPELRLPALRHVICGGGKLDAASLQAAGALFPDADIREFYGAAETSFITISDRATPQASVGRAYPGVGIEIRDANGRKTEETGEIWVQSPYLFLRYAEGQSDDTRWSDGFLSVGELGRMDAQGHLYLAGRRSRMVTVADQNVFPEAIEAHLLTLPGIRQCAVLALPDPMRGHALIAVIEGREDGSDDAAAIRQSCRDRLGAASTPRRIVFLDRLPMLAGGKPDLVALRAQLGASA